MKTLRHIFITLLAAVPLPGTAQRPVTPVESDDKKPAAPVLHYYDKHGKPLDEPVLFLATLDTVQSTPTGARAVYPRFHAVDFGLNFMDGILAIAGQHYGGADVSASLSMWNWLFPTVELGLGGASCRPAGLNYTYKGSPGFYAKIGADYNFLYKSNPQYRVFLGLRAGFSSFSYSLRDVSISNSYWDQTETFDITGQKSTALYGEVLAGLRVNIYKSWSLGWTVRYRFMFSCSDGSNSRPWYIPGYGSRTNPLGFTLSAYYTLPLSRAKESEPEAKTL